MIHRQQEPDTSGRSKWSFHSMSFLETKDSNRPLPKIEMPQKEPTNPNPNLVCHETPYHLLGKIILASLSVPLIPRLFTQFRYNHQPKLPSIFSAISPKQYVIRIV
ncbi:hypothetical protein DID88_008915 [Monilinia fructigena]|uniref:Uncharacterized protein n=1 Tax=Monilinia fructigena TaxID=38457 RepID=A0A395J7A1_9HELO|nr:hypothetical protein DID88_008915 [Monilinia fructigena]